MLRRPLAAILLVALPALAVAGSRDRRESWPHQESRTLQETRRFPAGTAARTLEIDAVDGAISVAGGGAGDAVEMTIRERRRARTPEALERSRREVRLDLTQEGGVVRAYVDGPFRCCQGEWRSGCCRDRGDTGYAVAYDFEVRVPARVDLVLQTVNDGDIEVAGVRGERFSARNVNGKVALLDVAGAGEARTVNGGVTVRFAENPRADCDFETVNGDLDVAFRPGLAADLRLKTFNGDAWSDFAFQPVARRGGGGERRDGKFVYRWDRASAVRVGAGGPELRFETLNGDILVRNQGR